MTEHTTIQRGDDNRRVTPRITHPPGIPGHPGLDRLLRHRKTLAWLLLVATVLATALWQTVR
jgi:hypothetical protein